jgi:transcriptional regulator GlxA family with amidase domain
MSLRNFVRRFKQATSDSPLMYLQKLRIAAAKHLLENDRRTVQEISDAVGNEGSRFSGICSATHRVTPSTYRRRFGV